MPEQKEGGIAWTDRTWNPTRGCSRVSPGCVNCYAERIAARFSGEKIGRAEFTARSEAGDLPPFFEFARRVNGHAAWTGKVELIESKLKEPLSWRKPCRVFVNSMSDLFHESLAFSDIHKVFLVMGAAERHTFQILTKRPEIMRAFAVNWTRQFRILPNVWMGVSVEDQQRADERIPLLLQTPAAVRFVSYEPALGPVDFGPFVGMNPPYHFSDCHCLDCYDRRLKTGTTENRFLDWIITGAESGPGARPFNEDWARSTRDRCVAAECAFFYKQNAVNGHKIGTPELDGRQWMQFPGSANA